MDGGRFKSAAEILEPLWKEWREEHRFGILLAGCLAALRRVSHRREVLARLEANMADQAAIARKKLEKYRGEDGVLHIEGIKESEAYEVRRLLSLTAPDQGTVAYLNGFQKMLEGLFTTAVTELEQGLGHDTSAPLQMRLGHAHLQTKSWERAAECFRAALERDPDQMEAHLGLAVVRDAQGDHARMLDAALTATDLIFHNPRGHALVGKALLHTGRYDEAERAFELALHQQPVNREAVRGLSKLHRDLRPDEFKLKSHELRMYVVREQMRAEHRKRKNKSGPEAAVVAGPTFQAKTAPWLEAAPEQVVAVVSGLPRSGTSMMMQMLVEGGLAPYTDLGRSADSDNPRGYYEHDMAARLASNDQWLPEVRGKVVKIVAPLLPKLPLSERYAIVMMHRDLSDVAASQRAMLDRLGRKGAALGETQLIEALRREMERVERWMASHPAVRVLNLRYEEVLDDPAGASRRLAAFLGRPLDIAAMERAVQPSLRRQNRAQLDSVSAAS